MSVIQHYRQRRRWSFLALPIAYVVGALALAELVGILLDVAGLALMLFAALMLAPVVPPRARARLRREFDRAAWQRLASTGKLAAYARAAVKEERTREIMHERTTVLEPVPTQRWTTTYQSPPPRSGGDALAMQLIDDLMDT